MGLSDKIVTALQTCLNAEYIRLDDDDGISGFVVSRRFENMPTLDRQQLIDDALRGATDPLSNQEQHQVLMIAGLTPMEYEAADSGVRVHRIVERSAVNISGGKKIEVMLHGNLSDAMYVKSVFDRQAGIVTEEPSEVPGAKGIFMRFCAYGTPEEPLTKAKAIALLKADQYIHLMEMPNNR